MSGHIDWRETCVREHAERVKAARAMAPSTCKRATRRGFFARLFNLR